jgi:SAM-dependent methyltransferase
MSESIREHYDDPENPMVVAARFAVYDYAEPLINIHDEEVNLLSRLGRLASTEGNFDSPVVLDVGSSRGDMLARLVRKGFQGMYIGLDLSFNQLETSKDQLLFVARNTLRVNGSADMLPIRKQSVDISLINFMLYHQNEDERKQTYSEVKRVTKPEGVVIAATSGVVNKGHQRMYEFLVAEELGSGTKAPEPMTRGFNSERAETEIPDNFPGWYLTFVEQHSVFEIRDEERVDASLNSIRTLRGLFDPKPTQEAFESVMGKIKARLMRRISDGRPLVDEIHRTFIVASPQPTGLPERIVLGE